VDVSNVTDVSELHAASIFRVEMCKVGEFLYMYRTLLRKQLGEGDIGALSAPIETVHRRSCAAGKTGVARTILVYFTAAYIDSFVFDTKENTQTDCI
jgi:hypothetical protein